jgi:hypothetical protein
MNETPSVTSTCPCTLPARRRRMKPLEQDADQADAEAGAEHRDQKLPP